MSFEDYLQENGWRMAAPATYSKGSWRVFFDTSAWIEVGTERNPRIFDVPVPERGRERWTLELIEHLCRTDQQLSMSTDV
ncbi:MAG TPA: hypothetical protein VIU34_17615 [Steroidobacter sp.]